MYQQRIPHFLAVVAIGSAPTAIKPTSLSLASSFFSQSRKKRFGIEYWNPRNIGVEAYSTTGKQPWTFQVALETLEGHQRAIMGSMTVEVSLIPMLQCKECTIFCGWLRVWSFCTTYNLSYSTNLDIFATRNSITLISCFLNNM
jgi:hypothetical protein